MARTVTPEGLIGLKVAGSVDAELGPFPDRRLDRRVIRDTMDDDSAVVDLVVRYMLRKRGLL